MAVPGEEITFKEEDSENDLELDNAMQTAISDAVSKVGITDIFEGNELDLWVVADKKGLRTAVFDDYHISLCEYGDMKFSTKLEFNLPFSTFTTINDLSDGEAYDIVVGSSTIRAHNDFFRIVMPLLQDNDREQTIEDVIGLCTSLSPKKSDASFTIGQDDLDITLDNINSVHEEGVGCELIFGKDDVHFHLKTGFGEVNDYPPVEKVKGKKGSTLILNQHLLSDCLNAYSSKGKIDFHVKDENIIWCQDATEKYTATYVTLLLN
ncbi:hypothetical protein GR7B_00074 [Vibrio phage vB_VcorM_GR7B]|nr:hypothetical protein GR7B_00074 [Vibrio phage vB_VcorM_GR7B]